MLEEALRKKNEELEESGLKTEALEFKLRRI